MEAKCFPCMVDPLNTHFSLKTVFQEVPFQTGRLAEQRASDGK